MRPEVQFPAWLERAHAELGVEEIPGSEHNPRIIEYGKAVTLKVTTDEIFWCSNYVNWSFMGICDRTRSAMARSWLRWGIALGYPAIGCVGVLKRGGGKQPGPELIEAPGHVGFFMGYDDNGWVRLLNGNVGDKVCITAYPPERVLGFRWPA